MIRFLLTLIFKHKIKSFLLAILLFVGGVVSGDHLPIRLSISDLLPEDRTSVKEMKAVANYVGGVGYFIVIVGPTEKPEQYLPQISETLRSNSENINYVFHEREKHVLNDKALYLMPRKDFRKISKHVKTLFEEDENSSSSGLGLGLSDKPLEERKEDAREFFDSLRKKTESEQYYISKDGQYAMVLAKPKFNSEDIRRSRELVERTKAEIPKVIGANIPFNLVGRFADKVRDTRQIENDIRKTGLISIIGLSLLLLLGLGSFRGTFVTMGGVIVSLGWTTGLAKHLVGQINILTAFLLAILGGLGVEYGIHLIRRYHQERRFGRSHIEALQFTHVQMGRTLFSAAVTSACAFLILAFSDFRGFSELGIIAGCGIVSIYFSYMLTFPVLGKILDKSPMLQSVRESFGFYPFNMRWSLPVFAAILLICAGLFNAEFEYDFKRMHRLSAESTRMNDLSNELFGKSLSPAAILAQDKDQAKEISEWLREDEQKDQIDLALAVTSIVPTDMKYRKKRLRKLKRNLDDVEPEEFEEKVGISYDKVERWLTQEPYKLSDLPPQLNSVFGETGRIVYAYPRENLDKADGLRRFTTTLGQVREKFPGAQIGSDATVFVEILDHIINDGQIVLVLFLLGAFIVFWLDFRSVKSALVLEFQLIMGMVILTGLMGLIDERFSILNVAMIPAVLAAGVDMGVHVRHRKLEGFSSIRSARFVAQAVQLSALATIVGFGALFFTEAGILRGIAWISVLGQVSMYLVCMVFVPVLRDGFWYKFIDSLKRMFSISNDYTKSDDKNLRKNT